jgi:SAM-dependent methyltransferase
MEHDFRAYWETNIELWGDYYLEVSHGHEQLRAPAWVAALYRFSIGRVERRLMAERYARTIKFLNSHLTPGLILSDLGCGTGIFTVEALRRGAIVNAVDFAEAAINITRENVTVHAPGGNVNYIVADVAKDPLPRSDVTLAMGLAPYIGDLDGFLNNVLTSTQLLCCLFVDPFRWPNRLRRAFPFLNLRKLQFHSRADVDRIYARHYWKLIERSDFATGYIDVARAAQKPRH